MTFLAPDQEQSVSQNPYIRDYEENAANRPFYPPPPSLTVTPIKAYDDGTIYHLLQNGSGEIVSLYELLEILSAIKPFYDWMSDSEILRHNEAFRERREAQALESARQSKEPRQRKPNPGFVYLLQTGPYYKIGMSKCVDERIKQLSALPPFELELVCTIETEDMYSLERELHARFDHRRRNGEWFELDAEDVEYILALARGQRQS